MRKLARNARRPWLSTTANATVLPGPWRFKSQPTWREGYSAAFNRIGLFGWVVQFP